MSTPGQVNVVTGAFSYSGAAIARHLLAAGHQVRTLTSHPGSAPAPPPGSVTSTRTRPGTGAGGATRAGAGVTVVRPLDFTDPAGLVEAMRGAHTLYNTYWVRFAHGGTDHRAAVLNSRILFDAAAEAGIRRIVHVSITHPSLESPYPYFRGKAEVEQILADSGVPCAIARPAILFGGNDVLVNNIAWLLRRLPVFALGDGGSYRIRPIHVDDLARLCVGLGARTTPSVVDAVGPQSLTFRELVGAIRAAVGSRALLVPVPGPLIYGLSAVLGAALRDTLLTRDEYRAMADGLADSAAPATGQTVFSDWVAGHGPELGSRYASELSRHFRPARASA